ncbi:hypothetical protein JCGZ_20128 [Jatropha curcas]|uniref:Uncharacterized protein n=1 Tax=Jatropha curcas TaxID=180498 RepID=A0A067JUA0_JATCU|nr:hypothetical protein JCGZ_20128 [Jatropha curcas]
MQQRLPAGLNNSGDDSAKGRRRSSRLYPAAGVDLQVHHDRQCGEGCGGRSGQTNHYLLKMTLYSASTNDFEHFGVRIAKFWVAWDFPATLHDDDGSGGAAILRQSTKRQNLPLLA